jgi:sodium/bile acid cotransporter 7
MLANLRNRWFMLALVAVLAFGMIWSSELTTLAEHFPRRAAVAAVMLLMALPMETSAMWQAVRRPGAAWLAAAINSGLAPLLGWLAARLLPLPEELATGVIVATVVPCTLAAASVWTRRAGGNDAVAILVTMMTNLACFLVIPFWLRLLVGGATVATLQLDYRGLMLTLALLVVLPIIVAQLLRQWRPLGAAASRHKVALGVLAQVGILSYVFIGAIGCGQELREKLTSGLVISVGDVVLMIAAVTTIHLALLKIGLYAARALALSRPDAIAVGIAGSQKTIVVGLHLASLFGPLAILPMVAYHAAQLLIDTLIADWLRRQDAFVAYDS